MTEGTSPEALNSLLISNSQIALIDVREAGSTIARTFRVPRPYPGGCWSSTWRLPYRSSVL